MIPIPEKWLVYDWYATLMLSATTIILPQCSKSMHRWNPLCKGFILSHFGQACFVGQHCVLIHTIVRKALVKYCKRTPKGPPRRERVKGCFSSPIR